MILYLVTNGRLHVVFGKKVHGKNVHGKIVHGWKKGPGE